MRTIRASWIISVTISTRSRGLHDLQRLVVDRRHHRRTGRADEAAFVRRSIFRIVGGMQPQELGPGAGARPASDVSGTRPFAGSRISEVRRPGTTVPFSCHSGLSSPVVVHLEVAEPIAPASREIALVCGRFLLGEHGLVGEPLRPLERRHRVVGPDALKIGMAVARAWKGRGGEGQKGENRGEHAHRETDVSRKEPQRPHKTAEKYFSAISAIRSAVFSVFFYRAAASAAGRLRRLGRIGAVGRCAGARRAEEQLLAVRIGHVAAVGAEQRMVARLVAVDHQHRARP